MAPKLALKVTWPHERTRAPRWLLLESLEFGWGPPANQLIF